MSDPTLEQIAAADAWAGPNERVLARELLGLRAMLLADFRHVHGRIDALEGREGGVPTVVGVDGPDLLLSDGTTRPTQAAYKRIEILTAERDAAREALRKYGRHLPDCPEIHSTRPPCTCGLIAALASKDS